MWGFVWINPSLVLALPLTEWGGNCLTPVLTRVPSPATASCQSPSRLYHFKTIIWPQELKQFRLLTALFIPPPSVLWPGVFSIPLIPEHSTQVVLRLELQYFNISHNHHKNNFVKSFCFSSEWFSMIRTNGKPETGFLFSNHQQIDYAFYKKLNTNTWQKLNMCCKCVNPKPVLLLKSRQWSGETGRLIWTVEAFLNKQWEYLWSQQMKYYNS